jgi:hypothetical protein
MSDMIIVPSRSTGETLPNSDTALLRSSAMISQFDKTHPVPIIFSQLGSRARLQMARISPDPRQLPGGAETVKAKQRSRQVV